MMKKHENEQQLNSTVDRTERVTMVLIVTLFVLTLLPILYVGLKTYPTGDDFWYGKYIARAWWEQHSIIACIAAACRTIKEFYYTWQGTWFSIFLFCFNPEIFVKGGYKFVPVLAISLLTIGFYLVMRETMVKTLKLSKTVLWICLCVTMLQVLQFMPRTTSGIYWFNGIMHYNANTFVSMIAIAMMICYMREGKKYALILTIIGMFLIGGGNYQAALMPLLIWGLIVLGVLWQLVLTWWKTNRIKDASIKVDQAKETTMTQSSTIILWFKRALLLGIGVLVELPGLAISAMAPGNSVRSEEFEMSLKWALQSVWYSIDRGIYLVRDDFYAKYPMMVACILLLAVILWGAIWKIHDKTSFTFPMPLVFVVYMCGFYWASYTPGIFSKSDVSGGVPDTIQQMFLLTSLANVIYVMGYVQRLLLKYVKEETLEKAWWGPKNYQGKVKAIATSLVALVLLLLAIKGYQNTTDYLCVKYVKEGRMQVYDLVRREQLRILEEPGYEDVRIPELFNYDYYPVCHLMVETNPEYQLNVDEQIYFHKKSVVGYDFREWMEANGYLYMLEGQE